MILGDFLKTMKTNENVSIALFDSDEKPLITFNCKGYEAVESEIQKRVVRKIKIDTERFVLVYIEDAVVPSV